MKKLGLVGNCYFFHILDTGIGVSGCIVHTNIKETELWSSDQEAFPSADKNTGVVLVPCCAWKCVPTGKSDDVDILKVLGCHLLRQMSSPEGHENYLRHLCLMKKLAAYFSHP